MPQLGDRMSWGTACCPNCGEPLIPTIAWRKKEFICICCGRLWEFLQPVGKHGPEIEARYDELKAEWDEHASGIMPDESEFWRRSCDQCNGMPPGGHLTHAAKEEIEGDRLGREWLKERTAA